MSANRSLGVWCKAKAGANSTEIEAHFNYWRIASDPNFDRNDNGTPVDFVEIGIFIDDASTVELVRIFLPFCADSQLISDCSLRFEDAEIAQGIFNEVLKVTGPAINGPKCVELLRGDGTTFARVHNFASTDGVISSTELSVVERDGGSLITIEPAALNDAASLAAAGDGTYFRLRLYLLAGANNPLIRILPTHDRLLQSSYEEIEYMDFRVNEARTLPDPIEQLMRNDQLLGSIRIRLIAFLAAVPVTSELSVSNTPSHKMRLLEHDLWNSYVPGGIPEGMVVYHWKRDSRLTGSSALPSTTSDVRDFTAFVKLQTKRSSNGIWVAYLFVAFLIGIAGNLASDGVRWIFSDGTVTGQSSKFDDTRDNRGKLPRPEATLPSVANNSAVENGS